MVMMLQVVVANTPAEASCESPPNLVVNIGVVEAEGHEVEPGTHVRAPKISDLERPLESGSTVGHTPTGPDVSSFEASLDFENLVNEYEVRDGSDIVIYVGEALDLYYENKCVRGKARLTRYNRTDKGIKLKKKAISWFPPRFETIETHDYKDTKVWSIKPAQSPD